MIFHIILRTFFIFLFRYTRSRGYGDANIPPTIVLEGAEPNSDNLDQEKQIYQPEVDGVGRSHRSDSKASIRQQQQQTNGCGRPSSRSPSTYSGHGRRRGSGNNNSNHGNGSICSSNGGGGGGGVGPPSRKASSTRSASDPFANYTNAGPLRK